MLDPLYRVVAEVILFWHSTWAGVFGTRSDAAWVLAIVFLTVTVRVVIFPLFVKQVRSQRAVQLLAPKLKELQAKHKGDKETLNREMMKMYKENKANPLAGCFPLLLQMPIFFALLHVLRQITLDRQEPLYGISAELVRFAADAKFFGAPLASTFRDGEGVLAPLEASPTTVKAIALVMTVLMGASTFITQKQMMARQGVAAEGPQAQVQKILLYVMPLSFAFLGFSFPIGVLLYWLTTNIWSMCQQQWVIRRMPPPGADQTPPGPKGTTPPDGDDGGSPRGPTGPAAPSDEDSTAPRGRAPRPAPPPRQQVHAANRRGKKSAGSRSRRRAPGR